MSDDSHNRQWRSADAWRGNSLRQRTRYFLSQWNSSKIRQQCCRLESFARITDIHMSGPTVNNHVSLTTVLGYNVIRKTTYRSWSRVYWRTLPRQARLVQHLQHHYRRKVQAQHLFQHQLNVRVQTSKHGTTRRLTLKKTQTQQRCGPWTGMVRPVIFRNTWMAARYSERILWMKESLRVETHTRVLLVNPLWSRRDEWYRANTVFMLTSRKTEIARSARGLKLQGQRAEDVLVKSYIVQKILVTW